jgi:RNA polymerase primary sigma factor
MKQIRTNSDTVISRDVNLERYLKDIRITKPLSAKEEREVIKKAQDGDRQAIDKLITSNLKFVVSVAKEYQTPGVEIIDLISAGNLGLIEAIPKFNLEKEYKFISYAVWWIKNGIIEYLRQNVKQVRLPYNQQDHLKLYNDQKEKLEKKFECSLSIEQVMENTELVFDVNNIRQSLTFSGNMSSLSDPLSTGEDEGVVEDLLVDPQSNFFETYTHEYRKDAIRKALSGLSDIQRTVLSLSFGIEDGTVHSNEDIAEKLDLTAERIRQIKNKALVLLKDNKFLSTCL